MKISPATFVVSLDFELHWGVRDKKTVASYRSHLLGVRQAVPAMLQLFREYDIHATWATVGLLFFKTRDEVLGSLPARKPGYSDANLSPYPTMESIGADETEDPFHFGLSLIHQIAETPFQEIGTHTFSHYFCIEPGQTVEEFDEDLTAAVCVAKKHGMTLKSIVFPRNQCNRDYLAACRRAGLTAYRGDATSWITKGVAGKNESSFRRMIRLLDAYLPISFPNAAHLPAVDESTRLMNVPSSRFLRPFSARSKVFDRVRLLRITQDLTHAARTGKCYHLYWHPHNFGVNLQANIEFLRKILCHYASLNRRYGMQSLNMAEVADRHLVPPVGRDAAIPT